jgi:hypothetical protein
MLTATTAISPDADAAVLAAGLLALGEAAMQQAGRFFSEEFHTVALFSGIGLLVSLVAVFFGEQGVWI